MTQRTCIIIIMKSSNIVLFVRISADKKERGEGGQGDKFYSLTKIQLLVPYYHCYKHKLQTLFGMLVVAFSTCLCPSLLLLHSFEM